LPADEQNGKMLQMLIFQKMMLVVPLVGMAVAALTDIAVAAAAALDSYD